MVLEPKVPIANLLGMLEQSYGFGSLQLFAGTIEATTVPHFYDRLTHLLVTRVLAQIRSGLYRPAEQRTEVRPYIRGRVQIDRLLRQPFPRQIPAIFSEPTVDVVDNQILYWTLQQILRRGEGSATTLALVRHAVRTLQPVVTLTPCTVAACRERHYTRLNRAYAPLHALCAFFLEASGPSHQPGSTTSIPFAIDMARLYERFVAAWLQQHIAPTARLQIQERHTLSNELHFAIDLVLYDQQQRTPLAVLDTKYKSPTHGPATADVAQVVAYAAAKGVNSAFLIYPQPLPAPLDATIGGVRVRTVTFALAGDLACAGQALLRELGLATVALGGV